MKIELKIRLFLLLSLVIFGVGIKINVFAQTNENDCNKIILDLKDQDLIDEKIIPQLDIQIAVDNMISYCCEINGITNKETCPKLKNDGKLVEGYPQSPYFFDHIVDVLLRRLDAEQLNIGYEGISFDEKGLARRTEMDKIAESKDGTTPLVVKTKYEEAFKFDNNVLDIPTIVTDYSDFSLYERYLSVCTVGREIYSNLVGGVSRMTLKLQDVDGNGMLLCKTLVNNRTKSEMDYAKTVMLQKTNETLSNSMKAYLGNYFAVERTNNLSDTLLLLKNALAIVNKKIGEAGTKNCTK